MGSRRNTPAEYEYDDLSRPRLVPGFLADTRLHVLLVLAALLALLVSTGHSATRAPLASDHSAHCRVCAPSRRALHFSRRSIVFSPSTAIGPSASSRSGRPAGPRIRRRSSAWFAIFSFRARPRPLRLPKTYFWWDQDFSKRCGYPCWKAERSRKRILRRQPSRGQSSSISRSRKSCLEMQTPSGAKLAGAQALRNLFSYRSLELSATQKPKAFETKPGRLLSFPI